MNARKVPRQDDKWSVRREQARARRGVPRQEWPPRVTTDRLSEGSKVPFAWRLLAKSGWPSPLTRRQASGERRSREHLLSLTRSPGAAASFQGRALSQAEIGLGVEDDAEWHGIPPAYPPTGR